MSVWNTLLRLGRNKQVLEGARIHPQQFVLPFRQDFNLLTTMFQVRKWFVLNTPHKTYAERYTSEMADLHNELNYQQARGLLRRTSLTAFVILSYFWFIAQEDALDWKDTFDLKFEKKAYGSIAGGSGEGSLGMQE